MLREDIVETMRIEWAEGQNIGEESVLREVAKRLNLDADLVITASKNPVYRSTLAANAAEAAGRLAPLDITTIYIEFLSIGKHHTGHQRSNRSRRRSQSQIFEKISTIQRIHVYLL